MRDSKNEISSYIQNLGLLLLGILFLTFPLVFSTLTTDAFALPKQILLSVVILLALVLFGAKMLADRKVKMRLTPFDMPLLFVGIAVFLSSIRAVNYWDAMMTFIPFFFALLAYYLIINFAKRESSIIFLVAGITIGAAILSLLGFLQFAKLFILPFEFAKNQAFTPLGSLLDQALYLAFIFPLSFYFALPLIKNKRGEKGGQEFVFLIASVIILIGFCVTIYQLVTTQRPLLLPYETGFQTAFAAISQDAGRIIEGFLFGSGFGTYISDFTRFKQAAFNANQDLWSLTFLRSSSFILELLATTGFLGTAAFIFLILKTVKMAITREAKTNAAALALLLAIVAMFLLPFSFTIQTLFFFLLGIFAAIQVLKDPQRFYEVELHFVAFRKSVIPFSTVPVTSTPIADPTERSFTKILPISTFLLILVITGFLGYNIVQFITSDVIFQNSLVAASKNQGLQTYTQQSEAIGRFPYRDAYHRIYSQTNLAIANALAAQQPQNSSPSAQVQQQISGLIQQSINEGRNATALAPQTAANWSNLSSIYRGLIGVGQNADAYAIVAQQQATALDPNNPQEYVNLGGIYYQLEQWDNAARQFQIAIQLKQDFANAYYNLGHTLENKGDYASALQAYQIVQQLIVADKENSKRIKDEIDVVQQKVGQAQQAQQQAAAPATTGQQQQPIGINQPQTQLPETRTKTQIPGPTTTPIATPTPTTGATVSPTVAPSPTVTAAPTPAL